MYIAYIWAYLSSSFVFYLPAFIANLAVFLVYARLGTPFPLDLDKKLWKNRLIGDGRSTSGYMVMFVVSIAVVVLQGRNAIEGLYFGLGTNFGCILNSFIKRRLNIKRGGNFHIIDEIDYILGASLFYITFRPLNPWIILSGCLWALFLNKSINIIFRKRAIHALAKNEKTRKINK